MKKRSIFSIDDSTIDNPPNTILPNESFDEDQVNSSENDDNNSLSLNDDENNNSLSHGQMDLDEWIATFSMIDTRKQLEFIVDHILSNLKNCDPKTDDVSYHISNLTELVEYMAKHKSKQLLKRLGKYLKKMKVVQLAIKWMKIPREEYFEQPLSNNNCHVLLFLMCLSCIDAFAPICKSMVKLEFYDILIKMLSNPALGMEQFEEAKAKGHTESKIAFSFADPIKELSRVFTIMYNIMRNYPPSRSHFREKGIVDVCLRYLPIEITDIKALALVCIAFAADLDDEKNKKIIEATESNLLFFQEILKVALSNVDHRDYPFSVEEVIHCLSRLAKNQKNAIELTGIGILDMCMKVLKKEFSDGEIKWTLNLIWSLCFVEEIKDKISNSGILERVSGYVESTKGDFSEAARGIVWELGPKRRANKNAFAADKIGEKDTEVDDRHIMISYSWKQQPLAKKIFHKLRHCGQKVWLDIDGQMAGDSLEKMAEAVEKASFVICCISEDYKNSKACRSEASYAYQEKKNIVFVKQEQYKPNGWLGLILGSHVYYELFDAQKFEHQFTNMIDYMNKESSVTLIKTEKGAVVESRNVTLEQSLSKVANSVVTWSSDEVMKWLNDIGLSDNDIVQSKLKGLNGEQIYEMRSWLLTSTTYFLNFCESKLGLSDPSDLMKFSSSVRELQ